MGRLPERFEPGFRTGTIGVVVVFHFHECGTHAPVDRGPQPTFCKELEVVEQLGRWGSHQRLQAAQVVAVAVRTPGDRRGQRRQQLRKFNTYY